MWEKFLQSQAHDKNVFSLDYNVHIEKVKEENYVYLTDFSGAVSAKSRDCSLDVLKEIFNPSDYTLGLQNNSVYTHIVSNM